MSDSRRQSSEQQASGPSPLFISVFAGTITASVLIPGAFWLRRRRKIQFVPPPRTTIKRGRFNRLPLPASSSVASGPPERIAQRADAPPPLSRSPPLSEGSPSKDLETPENEDKDTKLAQLDFSPALLAIKALGIATIAVAIGAVGLVWGVKNAMGVETTEQFAPRMRQFIITQMPKMSSRIHRSHLDEDVDARPLIDPEWNWEEAERRLKDAFDKKGISGWAEAAVQELEMEEAIEREKRAIIEDGKK
ncbi:hypothetical protein L218DRAFT_534556 [Marasmius fiardii PR-910]|nr:hypothetical protein L218DRAFT_534556 [Marasmius fiardii PR-910]